MTSIARFLPLAGACLLVAAAQPGALVEARSTTTTSASTVPGTESPGRAADRFAAYLDQELIVLRRITAQKDTYHGYAIGRAAAQRLRMRCSGPRCERLELTLSDPDGGSPRTLSASFDATGNVLVASTERGECTFISARYPAPTAPKTREHTVEMRIGPPDPADLYLRGETTETVRTPGDANCLEDDRFASAKIVVLRMSSLAPVPAKQGAYAAIDRDGLVREAAVRPCRGSDSGCAFRWRTEELAEAGTAPRWVPRETVLYGTEHTGYHGQAEHRATCHDPANVAEVIDPQGYLVRDETTIAVRGIDDDQLLEVTTRTVRTPVPSAAARCPASEVTTTLIFYRVDDPLADPDAPLGEPYEHPVPSTVPTTDPTTDPTTPA